MANSTLCANNLNTTNICNVTCYGGCNKDNYFCCVNFPNSSTCINYICFYNTNKITTLKNVYVCNDSWPSVVKICKYNSNLKTVTVLDTPLYVSGGIFLFRLYYSV